MPKLSRFATKEEYNEWMRDYRARNREKMRIYQREYNREWRKKNNIYHKSKWTSKMSLRAEGMVRYFLKKGRIKKKDCKFCGSKSVIAHHDDYRKPLDVIWVCKPCHRELHYAHKRNKIKETKEQLRNKKVAE